LDSTLSCQKDEITLDEEEAPPKKTVEFEEAISFVNKMKVM
jgi:paired amphipathic helix protein Sin3a